MPAGSPPRFAAHPIFARLYPWLAAGMEDRGVAEHRDELLGGLSGRVIEVGAGNGLNFAHYPPDVTEVVAVEPEAHLRRLAEQEAARAPVAITAVDGRAEALPAPNAAFDAAVASLVLCSVVDPARAAAELRRVLRPGGQLRFYEHVVADSPRLARVQQLLDHVWPRFTGGCHTSRSTVEVLRTAGFEISQMRRFRFPETSIPSPTAPHVLGWATTPVRSPD